MAFSYASGTPLITESRSPISSIEILITILLLGQLSAIALTRFGISLKSSPFVGMLMMLDAVYPPPDSQPYLNDDKWLLYYLDNCRTVAEAVALAPTIRVNCLLGRPPGHTRSIR